MKHTILSMILILAITTTANAMCNIQSGYCDTSTTIHSPTLQEKYTPNNLKELKKTTAFENNDIHKIDPMTVNTQMPDKIQETTPNYNANCQFGVCLPGEGNNTNMFE